MTSPRKFAEKIALLNQKQAEGTAEFEQIMRDVHKATKVPGVPGVPGMPGQPALSPALSPSPSPAPSPSPLSPALSPADEAPPGGGGGGGGRGRSAGLGPMRSRPVDRQRVDTSPYGTPVSTMGPYLSPPADTTWRRTHSDSALHQSASSASATHEASVHAAARRADGHQHLAEQRNRRHLSASPDGRPRSSTASQPRAVTSNMYQLQQDMQSIPTGSLPDLTSLHFPPPLHTPLDQDDSNSPYGTSPRNSSAMLSPLGPVAGGDRFSYSPQTSRGPSPEPGHHSPHSPHSPRSPHSLHSPVSPHGPNSPNSLTVPGHFRYLHGCKVLVQDNGLELQSQVRQEAQNQYMYQHQEDSHLIPHMNASSPININNSNLQQSAHDLNSLSSYRNPQCITRPSPQSSPSLAAQHYRCSSPHSAPPSPISVSSSPSYMPENNFYTQAQVALQQGLEQFSMSDDPLTQVHELTPDPGYFSTSPAQLHYSQNHSHGHNNMGDSRSIQQPQTPNTPTSIPDIILTDADDLAKELGSAINVGSLDLEDVFPSDALRESLSRLDPEALDMLTNPNMDMVTDAATEAHFRMENDM